ncbi:hypothetical protein POVWA1_014920 [Plasmodium ovale wallikeri]|uniref:Uncharacterized protein n=1 Tax=Plasmodium ovale wallikeri TaxID=864142 RepID=A0A1A8YN88_PLAOA|nr:hypothetical protein POVWA1_014920 [Plasmodium ovale wallikeri]
MQTHGVVVFVNRDQICPDFFFFFFFWGGGEKTKLDELQIHVIIHEYMNVSVSALSFPHEYPLLVTSPKAQYEGTLLGTSNGFPVRLLLEEHIQRFAKKKKKKKKKKKEEINNCAGRCSN